MLVPLFMIIIYIKSGILMSLNTDDYTLVEEVLIFNVKGDDKWMYKCTISSLIN